MSSGYLVDSSVWHRAMRVPEINRRLEHLGEMARICGIIALELGVSARNGPGHEALMRDLRLSGPWLPCTDQIIHRAIDVQGQLASRGQHRSAKLADLLIAATAEANELTVLHYDGDFDLVAEVTGQPCEWVVERGSVS